MKIEEAIETLEEKRKYCKMFYELSANPQEDYPSTAKFMNALELAITALRSMQEAGEPLSLEQLREMDGKPVWCEDVERWAIVSVSDAGKWKDVPFALFEKNGGRFEWNAEDRELSLYFYPPAHIDRSKWEYCLTCRDLQYLPHEMCADVKMPGGSEIGASFCPSCGRPLTEEAWAELERRLRG